MAALRVEGLEKRYGAVLAVSDLSLAFEPGRIHAVVGENGAGKTTLLKMAAGIVLPDRGRVYVHEAPLDPHSPREAIRRGIGMVEQDFALIGAFSAVENVMLGREPVGAFGRLDLDAARATASAVAREMGILIPWDVPAAQLGVGDRQRLAIVRTLSRDAHVILLDEPTAVLTPGEANALYAALRRLADQGRAVVVATHRLVEVREHADVVSVLRRGKLASTRSLRSGDGDLHTAIMREVMGEEPPPEVDRPLHHLGEVRLDVRSLRCGKALDGVTMTVRAGEIVGIAGVEGNGQRELVRVLSGLQTPDSGEFWAEAVVVVHEDRQADGLVLDASVRDNLVLGELAHFTRFGLVDQAAVEREARSRLDRAQVIPADLDAQVRTLSGGNQQKIVVARAVARARDASVLVCAQPTRGVDSGAARAIHTEIARQADAGKAIMLVSADLSELRSLSDRILVMARGRIVIEVPPDAPDAVIGEAMLGRSPQEVVA